MDYGQASAEEGRDETSTQQVKEKMVKIVVRTMRNKWKTAILVVTLLFLSLSLYQPVKTVKGFVVNTGLLVTNSISMDEGRIAIQSSSTDLTINVYDIASGANVTFAVPPGGPNGGATAYFPVVSGNRIVIAGNLTISTSTIFYCELPLSSTLQPCGPWEIVAKNAPGASVFGAWGFPMSHGDLVAWPIIGGFAYWRFSVGVTTTVPTPGSQPYSVSTDGQIIAFSAKPTSSSPSYSLMYFDTSDPSRGVINTGLSSGQYSTSVSEKTIAFADNSSGTPNRLRYYNVLTNQASTAGTGPVGKLAPTYYDTPTIWENRIVFIVDEVSDGYDCNGNGTKSSSEYCLGYWNIRAPGYVATTLAPSAAPPLTLYPAIYGNIIAFKGSDGNLQYVTAPMKGDVDMNGIIDANDQNLVNNCLGQVLKGTVC